MHCAGGISLFEAYHSDLKSSTLIIPNDQKLAIKLAKANVARYYRALQHTFSIGSQQQTDIDDDNILALEEDDIDQQSDSNDKDYLNSQASSQSRSSSQSQHNQSTQNSSQSTSTV